MRRREKPVYFLLLIVGLIILLNLYYPEIYALTDFKMIQYTHEKWTVLYKEKPFLIGGAFFLFNMFMAMLPVPGISMISLLGGALFGFTAGFLLSSAATATGNLGGFFLARYFLYDWVHEKYGHRAEVFKKDWQNNGALALFSLRLFPLIPSFVANLIMGVSPLHWWTFFWVGWLGRIPMVLFYTLAGVQIAKIRQVEDILSLPVLVSFSLLALAPWLLKLIYKKLTRIKAP